MKNYTLLIFLVLLGCFPAFSQKEGNVWCFPDSCGINFNNLVTPSAFTCAIGASPNGRPLVDQSTISDSSGNLICYAAGLDYSVTGLYVFDRNHQVMPNGSQLQGHPNWNCLLLPFPDHDSLVCLLQIGHIGSTNFYPLYYSVINKNLNNGFGDVTLRDSLIYYQELSGHKLTAVRHGNGRDWWIVVYDRDPGEFVLFLLTPNGISFHGTQMIGSIGISLYYGKFVFSNDGSKLLSVGAYGIIDVFDFDRCTGTISNFRDIGEHLTTQEYQYFSPAFSPNGNLIYVSSFNLRKVLYQWNLLAPNIQASKTLIHEYPDTGLAQWNTYAWHNLGPDGKLYIPLSSAYQGPNINNAYTQSLDVIQYPDSVGLACNYVCQAFSLGGHFVGGGLPNMPYYGLGRAIGSACDSLSAVRDIEEHSTGISILPNPTRGVFKVQIEAPGERIAETEVLDVMGAKVLGTKGLPSEFDLSVQPDGIYFLSVKTRSGKNLRAKVLKLEY